LSKSKFDPTGKGLSREEEILARVVMDLGIADSGAIEGAIDQVSQARSRGEQTGLSQALKDSGTLHPRFAAVVERVVKSRLGAAGGGGEGRPSGPAPVPAPAAPSAPAPNPAPSPAPAAASTPEHPAPPIAPSDNRVPLGPSPTASEDPPVMAPPDTNSPYKQVPKGAGFSVRSKKDIASAWAAYKKGKAGGATDKGKKPEEPAAAEDDRPKPSVAASSAAPPAEEDQSAKASGGLSASIFSKKGEAAPASGPNPIGDVEQPAKPLFPLRGKKKAPPKGEQERLVPPTSGLGKQAGGQAKRAYKPRRGRRNQSTGVTQSIDINSLRDELGIKGKKQKQAEAEQAEAEVAAVPKDARQKEIALKAFVTRVVPSMTHQHALEVILKRRLTTVSPKRLSEELGCKEREARKVLEDWKNAGVARQEDPEIFQYLVIPSKADLALIREFLTLWNDATWHSKMLGWIIELGH